MPESNFKKHNIGVISSYIPSKCGIAHFTRDLSLAILNLKKANINIIAVTDDYNSNLNPNYPKEVLFTINKSLISSYISVADKINNSNIDIICLQHEYGLFGGNEGDYILKMFNLITKPIFTTLHTILKNPNLKQIQILKQIADKSKKLVVMSATAINDLKKIYNIDCQKVEIISHGIKITQLSKIESKKKLGFKEPILLMTGLINPDKGADYVINAMTRITDRYPNALFILLGETHPGIIAHQGEKYREYLKKLVFELNLQNNVKFINSYVHLNDLLVYYSACDIYLTPYLNPEQITSGTLAYALGMGKAIISTPYTYAKELLGENQAGCLVKFKDSVMIADKVIELLDDPNRLYQFEQKAYAIGKDMDWIKIAEKYSNIFENNYMS